MVSSRLFLHWFALGTAACGSAGPAHMPVPDRPPAEAPAPAAVPTATVTLAEDSVGYARASIGLGRALPDEQLVALLRRYEVLPYTLYFALPGARGIHEVPVAAAHLGLIADMRTERARQSAGYPCALIARLQSLRRMDVNVRAAPGERDEPARRRLTELRDVQGAAERLRRGEPAIFGARIVGRTENLRRLAADPLVRLFQGAIRPANDTQQETLVPGVSAPSDLDRSVRTPSPDVEAMSTADVHAQLDRLLDAPPAECREPMRNQLVTEPVIMLKRSTAGEYVAAGLHLRAAARLVIPDDVARKASGARTPPAVQVTLTVTNPASGAAEVGIRGCTMMYRLYRTGESSNTPVADQRRGMQCMEPPMRLRLAPGESREFQQRLDSWRVLDDSLPFGHYRVAVLFRLEDETVEVPAGEVELSSGLDGLVYAADVRVVDTVWRASTEAVLRASASLTNRSDTPVHIKYGACALSLRAYRNPQRTGTPVWRSEWRAHWSGLGRYACPGYLKSHTLRPGETFRPWEFQFSGPLIELLADSLPDGRYWFAATLRLNFRSIPEFAAGSAHLKLPRPPLPASRMADQINYEARSELRRDAGMPPVVHGIVVASYPDAMVSALPASRSRERASLLRYSAECPVVLYAYRERARRDAAPRSGAPDWKSRDDCGPEQQQFVMRSGESRTFQVHATAREILGTSLPPARYYLALAVLAERRRILLSAGEAVLAR